MKKYLSIIVGLMLMVSPVYALDSNGVIYDNSASGSSATNVNDALNDLYLKLNEKQTEINNIKNIGNATSNKILSGYTAYVKGNTITGSIPSKGATTYTPGRSNQTIASGQYLSGVQTIKGDANLVAANIAKGKSIFGINGTYTSDATATSPYIVNGKTAYVNGSKVTGTLPNRSCASCGASGVVGLNSDIWSNVAVSPFDGALHWQINTDGVKRLNLQVPYGVYGGSGNPGGLNGDGYVGIEVTRFGNATTSQVLNTATFTSENGMSIKGSIPNKGAATYTPGTSNQTIASGNYLSGTQTIKGDPNLVASNIAKGKSIFGVTGTYTGDGGAPTSPVIVTTKFGQSRYLIVETHGRDIKLEESNWKDTYWTFYAPTTYANGSIAHFTYGSASTTVKLTRDSTTGILVDSGKYEFVVLTWNVKGEKDKTITLTWV